ncbi:hypothetical protein [Natranaerobius thermophilus]|nr:hypothetical protein [Natranaerobius thermophilus]
MCPRIYTNTILKISPYQILTNERLSYSFKNFENTRSVPPRKKRNHNVSLDLEKIKSFLENALTEDSPPSLKEIVKLIGISDKSLYKYFPKLSKKIVDRRKQFIRLEQEERIKNECRKVIEITKKLHQQNIYPSRRKVQEVFGKRIIESNEKARKTWLETKMELGLI